MRMVTGGKVWSPEPDRSASAAPAPLSPALQPLAAAVSAANNAIQEQPAKKTVGQRLEEICDSKAFIFVFFATLTIPLLAVFGYLGFLNIWVETQPVSDYSDGGLPVSALGYIAPEEYSQAMKIIFGIFAIPFAMWIFLMGVYREKALAYVGIFPAISLLISLAAAMAFISGGPFGSGIPPNAEQWVKDKYGWTLEEDMGSGSENVKVTDANGFTKHVDVYLNDDKIFLYDTPEQLEEAKKG